MSHAFTRSTPTEQPSERAPAPLLRLALLAILAGAACAPGEGEAQAKEGSGLVMQLSPEQAALPADEVRPYFHDFGRVADGAKVRKVFVLENTDPGPVTIQRVSPGCGCTIPILRAITPSGEVLKGRPSTSKGDLLVVPPGAKVEVELAVDTTQISQKNTDKLVTTRVTTDSANGFYFSLEIHLIVERPFNVVPNGVDLNRVPVSGGGTGRVEIVGVPGYERRVTRILEKPDHVVAELWSEDRLGRTVWTLEAGYDPPLELGNHTDKITLETVDENGEVTAPIVVGVTGLAVPDIEPRGRFVLAVARDQSLAVTLDLHSLLSGHTFEVSGIEAPEAHADFFNLSYRPKGPDSRGRSGTWTLELETRAPLPEDQELLRGDLTVTLDDPQHPEVSVPYAIHLR